MIGLGANNDGTGVLRNFECGLSPLTQFVQASFIMSGYSPASTSVSSSSAPSTFTAAPTASRGQSLSTGQKVGIGVGVPLAVISLVISCHACYSVSLLSKHSPLSVKQKDQPLSNKRATEKSKKGDTPFMARLNSMSSSNIDNCKVFLSIYGKKGVWLQELLMLVRVMSFPAARSDGDRPWLRTGSLYHGNLSSYDLYLLDLVRDASSVGELRTLEQKLASFDVLEVRKSLSEFYGDTRNVHGRLWFANPPSTIKSIDLCRNLMRLYLCIPDRGIQQLAERHREVCYYHAHIAIHYVMQMVDEFVVVFHDHADSFFHSFFHVVVQVLSYRYCEKDARLLEFIKGFPITTLTASPKPTRSFHDKSQVHFLQVMLYLAELNGIMSQTGIWKHSFCQSLVQEKLTYLQNTIPRGHKIDYKAWGMIGYAQADLMDIAERAHDQEGIDEILRLMREWCDRALLSKTPIVLAALCCVLVRLRAFQELDKVPQSYHLMCGHFLSRSGMPQLASQFILSGIHYCEQETPNEPIWRYYLEFWTIAIGQGYWDEAELWLSSACKDVWQRSGALQDGAPEVMHQYTELEEYKVALATLLSDCYVNQGNYQAAASMLVMAIENTSPSHDSYTTNTRAALWLRLLNVQMELQELHRAGILAAALCYELGDQVTSAIASQTASWAAQEVLSCINELMRAEMCGEAYCILCLLRQSMLVPKDDSAFVDALSGDLITYINQLWDEVKSIFDPAAIVQEKHRRAFYKFGQLELLTSSLEKLYELGDLGLLQLSLGEFCAIADSLIRFSPENENDTLTKPLIPDFAKLFSADLRNCLLYRNNVWKCNDMRHLESLLSEARVKPKPASTNEEAPTRTSKSASILDIARHIARDHPYTFPLARVNEPNPTQTAEPPKRKVVLLPSLARTDEKQQMPKNKRREIWRRRRRENLRRLLQLRKPPENIITSPATAPVLPPTPNPYSLPFPSSNPNSASTPSPVPNPYSQKSSTPTSLNYAPISPPASNAYSPMPFPVSNPISASTPSPVPNPDSQKSSSRTQVPIARAELAS